jgi:hypothetical protein
MRRCGSAARPITQLPMVILANPPHSGTDIAFGKRREGNMTTRATLPAMLTLALIAGCSAADSSEEGTAATSTGGEPQPDNYPATEPCTTIPQSGCPAEHTCQVASHAGHTTCVKAGSAPVAGACSSSTDCAVGLSCVYGTCQEYCNDFHDCPGDVVGCIQFFDDDGEAVANKKYCTIPCNPVDAANVGGTPGLLSCPPQWGCYPVHSGAPIGTTDCYPVGPRGLGEPCENDCGLGLVCLNYGDHKECASVCLMGKASCSCQSFAEPDHAAIGGELVEVGYCE